MLSLQQQMILKSAVNGYPKDSIERREAVEQAIRMVQMMTPNVFHANPPHLQPTKSLKERVFFDEPVALPVTNYSGYKVSYIDEDLHKKFKRRNAIHYAGSKK